MTIQEQKFVQGDKVIPIYREFVSQLHGLLPLSANVDMLLFLLNLKPCVRTRVKNSSAALTPLERWCAQCNLHFDIEREDFIYIAAEKELLLRVKTIDHSFDPHETTLGTLLGYPLCCCEKIAQVGEGKIDDFEEWLIEQPFIHSFQLINPSAYRQGKAFISHVPCSTSCRPSLIQAQILVQFLLAHKQEKTLSPWLLELEKIERRAANVDQRIGK